MKANDAIIATRHEDDGWKGAIRPMRRPIRLVVGVLALAMVFAVPAMAGETFVVDAVNGDDNTCGAQGGNFGFGGGGATACETFEKALELAGNNGEVDDVIEIRNVDANSNGDPNDDTDADLDAVAGDDKIDNGEENSNVASPWELLGLTIRGASGGDQNASSRPTVTGPLAIEIEDVDIPDSVPGGDADATANDADITVLNLRFDASGANGIVIDPSDSNSGEDAQTGTEIRNNVFDGDGGGNTAINVDDSNGSVTLNGGILNNDIFDNDIGILFGGGGTGDVTALVENNSISDNATAGVDLQSDDNDVTLRQNGFFGNVIGVRQNTAGAPDTLTLRNNNFAGNVDFAIDNNGGPTVDAEQNHFDSANGPFDDDANATEGTTNLVGNAANSLGNPDEEYNDINDDGAADDGEGDAIDDSDTNPVDYAPWLTQRNNNAPAPSRQITAIRLICANNTRASLQFDIEDANNTQGFRLAQVQCDRTDNVNDNDTDVFEFQNPFTPGQVSNFDVQCLTDDGSGTGVLGSNDDTNLVTNQDYIVETPSTGGCALGGAGGGAPTNGPTFQFRQDADAGGGDGRGNFGFQSLSDAVQPLSVNGLQTSQLGPNYTFSVQGQGVASTSLQVFDLSGRSVANETSSGSTLRFRPMASNGAPLANGIYLYQVTVRGHDGTVQSMGVRKMLVLR